MKIEKLIRPNILSLKGYSSARDEYSGREAVLLDANESPFPTAVNRYPDPYQRKLKSQIGEFKGVSESQIFLGNGSDEAIDLIFRIFCEPGKQNVVITDPTYGMYEVSAGVNNIEVIKAPLNEDFTLNSAVVLGAVNDQTKVVFLCSPNNPSGNLLNKEELLKIISNFNGIVVIDEAYIDFSKSQSLISELDKYENIIVLQTFSKAWGMAGVRLGMAFASEVIISLFNKIKPPYNINVLTQDYALKQLSNAKSTAAFVEKIIEEREKLKSVLVSLKIVQKVHLSDSNFLLVEFLQASVIFDRLVDKKIITRNRTKVKFGANCLRITIGTPDENKLLINTLKEI